MFLLYKGAIREFLFGDKLGNLDDLTILYNNIYRYYLPAGPRLIMTLLIWASSWKHSKSLAKSAFNLYPRIR